MGNMMKVFLILMIVMSLLVLAGCQSEEVADPGTTTVPVEAGGEATEEPTTEKPVNIVEDPLGNGEGDPLDAIDGTTGESGPAIDIEIDEDAGSTTLLSSALMAVSMRRVVSKLSSSELGARKVGTSEPPAGVRSKSAP